MSRLPYEQPRAEVIEWLRRLSIFASLSAEGSVSEFEFEEGEL